jgi:hypothetical protein
MATVRKITADQATERLEAAADRMEPRIAEAFLGALDRLRERMPVEEIAARLQAGGVEGVVELLPEDAIGNDMQEVRAAITAAVVQGGEVAAEITPPAVGPQGRTDFVFNVANPRTQEMAERITSTRIREITQDVQDSIRETVTEGVTAGRNPRDTARTVRESIGLTRRQAQSVQNYRRALETGDADALRRELRDRRFDATVRRLIDGQQVDQGKIDRMVERYRERLVRHRSEVIARTESTRAIQGGQKAFMEQQIEEGRIERRQLRRFWHTSRDEKVRSSHRQIPSMNPNGVAQDEAFRTPLGPLEFPGDPSGSAENTINCRCTIFSRIVSLELLDEAAA